VSKDGRPYKAGTALQVHNLNNQRDEPTTAQTRFRLHFQAPDQRHTWNHLGTTTSICLVPPASKKTTTLLSLFNCKKRKRIANVSQNNSTVVSKNCLSNTYLDKTKVGHLPFHPAEVAVQLDEAAAQVQRPAPVLASTGRPTTLRQTPLLRLHTSSPPVTDLIAKEALQHHYSRVIRSILMMRWDISKTNKGQHHHRDLAEADSKGVEEAASSVPRVVTLRVDSPVDDRKHSQEPFRRQKRSVL
jgi:hypothetical protein